MLKSLLIIFAATVIITYGMPTNIRNFQKTLQKMVLQTVKDKCYQNATNTEYKQFVKLYNTSFECYEDTLKKFPVFITPLEEYKEHIQECFEDLVKNLEECLPEGSKDWPRLNFDLVYVFIDFTYENKDQLLTPKFARHVENCAEKFQEKKPRNQMFKCFLGETNRDHVLESKIVCEALTEMGNCTMTQLDKICPGDSDIEELQQNLLQSLKKPCSKFEPTENPEENLFTLLAPYAPPNMNPELM